MIAGAGWPSVQTATTVRVFNYADCRWCIGFGEAVTCNCQKRCSATRCPILRRDGIDAVNYGDDYVVQSVPRFREEAEGESNVV